MCASQGSAGASLPGFWLKDLLELYCGAGSHTLVLAPLFRHVLAVDSLACKCHLCRFEKQLVTTASPEAPSRELVGTFRGQTSLRSICQVLGERAREPGLSEAVGRVQAMSPRFAECSCLSTGLTDTLLLQQSRLGGKSRHVEIHDDTADAVI